MLSGMKESYKERRQRTTLTPSFAGDVVRRQPKRKQGHRRAGLLSFEKLFASGRRPRLLDGKATRAFALFASERLALRSQRT